MPLLGRVWQGSGGAQDWRGRPSSATIASALGGTGSVVGEIGPPAPHPPVMSRSGLTVHARALTLAAGVLAAPAAHAQGFTLTTFDVPGATSW